MDIKLKSMFYKDINRDIKGVIKVGQADEENVKQELEEYVVTGELNKHIDRFFEAYKTGIVSHTDKMVYGYLGSLEVVSLIFKDTFLSFRE
ncbi:hypothetical protein [Clostridium septicum]|uniref:hypothetical protein n=1 Tax=Clostridium septicum TaxID=1504 RepID=UPI001FAB2F09|nr:hypothetical protein [Clostridium septicum]